MPASRAGAPACVSAVLILAACRIDRLDPTDTLTAPSEQLAVTREPEAPAPLVLAHVDLSAFAADHLVELELVVQLTSGQSLERQGAVLEWQGDATAETARADFGGPLANTLSARSLLHEARCSEACRVTLAITPRGEWASDVAYPLRYDVGATLELEYRERLALPSDFDLSLELSP